MALYDPDQFTAATLTKGDLALQSLLASPAQRELAAESLEITPFQVGNLIKLAVYLRTLPADYRQFSMTFFYWDPGKDPNLTSSFLSDMELLDQNHPCGTVACAAGHGPAAGVPRADDERDWNKYLDRAFGGSNVKSVYCPMFSADWANWDNTPRGAAARIIYALTHLTAQYLHPCNDGDVPALYAQYVA
jgi:hypothetical protein